MNNGRLTCVLSCLALFIAPAFAQETTREAGPAETLELRILLDKFKSDDDAVRYAGLQSISKLGSQAIPRLAQTISKEDGYAKVYAARALRQIEPNHPSVPPTLVAISRDKREKLEVRRYATYVLALSPTTIPALTELLNDNDVFVQRSAVFALKEMFDISAHLPSGYKDVLTEAIPHLIAAMGAEDAVVRGVAAETVRQINGDIDFLLDYSIETSPNGLLRQSAKEVKERRKEGTKRTGQEVTMDMKPGAEISMKKNPKFLCGTLGLLYGLRIGGEPVVDCRSNPGTLGESSLRVTLNPVTHHAGSGVSEFNPYQDLH